MKKFEVNNFWGNVNGKARIFEKEITAKGKTFTVYNVTVSKKNEDGSFTNASIDARFSHNALKALNRLDPVEGRNGAKWYDVIVVGWLTVKESNGNVSTIIILGMIISLVVGGVPLVYSVLDSLKGDGMANFTYLFAGGLSVVVLIASLLYTFIGIKSKFERLSEGD